MESEYFNQNNDNLYKYIIIIGLSLLLIPQLNNANLINNLVKQVEFKHEIQKSKDKLDLYENTANKFYNEVITTAEIFNATIKNYIIERNLYLPNGKQVETIEELNIYLDESEMLLNKLENALENKANIQELSRLLKDIQHFFGSTGDIEDFENYLLKEQKRIAEMDEYIKKSEEELLVLEKRSQELKEELKKINQENIDMYYEIEKIELEGRFYKHEKNINDFLRIIGGLMIISGVFLWYIKIQRYHDNNYKIYQRKKISFNRKRR